MKSSKMFIYLPIILLLLVAGCSSTKTQQFAADQNNQKTVSSGDASSGKVVNVEIKNFKFVPSDVNIKAGDTVTWTNEDSVLHSVQSSDGTLKSTELSQGETFSYTFLTLGKYDYICGIHHSMKGSVAVQ